MKLPYVINNQTHTLVDILNGLLTGHKGRSLKGQKGTFLFLKSWPWHPANDEEKTGRH